MKIELLEVKNYRGIKHFKHAFGDSPLVCFVGRCNSAKSTVLQAINLCLSPRWSLDVNDSDFHNADINEVITIRLTLSGVPEELIVETRYGLYIRKFDRSRSAFVDINTEGSNIADTLTIELKIDHSLHPEWFVVGSNDNQKIISGRDREKLGVFMLTDYMDAHLSYRQGSPLYSLHKGGGDEGDVFLKHIRGILKRLEEDNSFGDFSVNIKQIKDRALRLGLSVDDADSIQAFVDARDINFKNNSIAIHNNKIPARLDGKGSKRLLSIAIQSLLMERNKKGIILIDEIEQGLEPYKIKHLINSLNTLQFGQVFIATHSREVVTELDAQQLFLLNNERGEVVCENRKSEEFQKIYRSYPEILYAKKALVCEGSTELGFIRALDDWRIQDNKKSLSNEDVVYVSGQGSSVYEYAKNIAELLRDKSVAVLCDSDREEDKPKKEDLRKLGIKVFDWEEGKSFEDQVFQDIGADCLRAIQICFGVDVSKSRDETRSAIEQHHLCKRVSGGLLISQEIFRHYEGLQKSTRLYNVVDGLSEWIDG